MVRKLIRRDTKNCSASETELFTVLLIVLVLTSDIIKVLSDINPSSILDLLESRFRLDSDINKSSEVVNVRLSYLVLGANLIVEAIESDSWDKFVVKLFNRLFIIISSESGPDELLLLLLNSISDEVFFFPPQQPSLGVFTDACAGSSTFFTSVVTVSLFSSGHLYSARRASALGSSLKTHCDTSSNVGLMDFFFFLRESDEVTVPRLRLDSEVL